MKGRRLRVKQSPSIRLATHLDLENIEFRVPICVFQPREYHTLPIWAVPIYPLLNLSGGTISGDRMVCLPVHKETLHFSPQTYIILSQPDFLP